MAEKPLCIVAVGAHMDDCYLGAGGTLLKAARAGHRVTLVTAVSQYGAWPTVSGRAAEIKPLLQGLADRAGVSLVTLGYDYERLENGVALITQLAQVLADLKPDVLFCHYQEDTNQDHVVLGLTTPVAAMHNACFAEGYGGPREIYKFKTDAQTLNFTPDTYVNITNEIWDAAGNPRRGRPDVRAAHGLPRPARPPRPRPRRPHYCPLPSRPRQIRHLRPLRPALLGQIRGRLPRLPLPPRRRQAAGPPVRAGDWLAQFPR